MERRAYQPLQFAGFELDPMNGVLRKNGTDIKLAPQPFKALVLLASRPGELVSREELRQAIWGDGTVVDFEHGLNTCIRQIRTALGEEARSAQFIETVPRLGYRFVAATIRRAAKGRGVRWVLAAIGTALAIASAALLAVRLAVRPFSSLGAHTNGEPPLADISAVQAEIAAPVGKALHLVPSMTPWKWPSGNPQAYAFYLRGRSALEQGANALTALKFFEQAVSLDASYAPAHAGIALAYIESSFTGRLPPEEAFPRAAQAAGRALALDGSQPDPHSAIAMISYAYNYDWPAAERECRRAIVLDPKNSLARHHYGVVLSLEGHFVEGLDQLRRAQSLDPLSPEVSWSLAQMLYYARRYDDAIAESRRTLELAPNYVRAYHILGQCYEQKGSLEQAIQAFLRTGSRSGNLGHAYAVAGRTGEARSVLAELEKRAREPGIQSALVYIGLGEFDHAFECLQRAYERRGLLGNTLMVAPVFDPLRSDPRFAQLLQKVGLAATASIRR